jgi:hypothetical protein
MEGTCWQQQLILPKYLYFAFIGTNGRGTRVAERRTTDRLNIGLNMSGV